MELTKEERLEMLRSQFGKQNGFDTDKPLAVELLKTVTEILDEFKIDYFLISGTLLGYIRHNDFIPWDDDIDLIVNSSVLLKIDDIRKKYSNLSFITRGDYIVKVCFRDKKIKLEKGFDGFKLENDEIYNWPFVDLFTWKYDIYGNMDFFKLQWDTTKFFPPQKVLFNGVQVCIPKEPHYFLDRNYGGTYKKYVISSTYNHKTERQIAEKSVLELDAYNIIKYIL